MMKMEKNVNIQLIFRDQFISINSWLVDLIVNNQTNQ
ncbi:unnamed protein product [Paramecium sonneborni]|uniref:Uncharacterized protein n=1 Tax=Paramecium sonneborni TaxID=65129 RepID=A0A8S1KV56_9CILI|nr:unnamed protein product [Paramecium sonneborni]